MASLNDQDNKTLQDIRKNLEKLAQNGSQCYSLRNHPNISRNICDILAKEGNTVFVRKQSDTIYGIGSETTYVRNIPDRVCSSGGIIFE